MIYVNKQSFMAPGCWKPRSQVFARKLVRVAGEVTEEAISIEVHAIEILMTPGHRNLVQVYSHGWLPQDSTLYFVDMELCAYDLDNYIYTQTKKIESSRLRRQENSGAQFLKQTKVMLQIAAQIATGLGYIHSLREVHRNLKPKNGIFINSPQTDSYKVLFSARDSKWKVADFGFNVEDRLRREITNKTSLETIGSYRAPELLKDGHRHDSSADMWAMGCIVYEMMTRNKAFQDDRMVRDYPNSVLPLTISLTTGCGISETIQRVASLNSIVNDLVQIEVKKRLTAQTLVERIDEVLSKSK